ncbi:hypothetical protein OSTOST_24267 [Ostertagia ostertagi]
MMAVAFSPRAIAAGGDTPFFDLTRYNDFPDFPEFEDYVRGVAKMNPEFVSLRLIGQSREGRPLLGLKVNPQNPRRRLAMCYRHRGD